MIDLEVIGVASVTAETQNFLVLIGLPFIISLSIERPLNLTMLSSMLGHEGRRATHIETAIMRRQTDGSF